MPRGTAARKSWLSQRQGVAFRFAELVREDRNVPGMRFALTRWWSGTDSNFRYHEWDLLMPETTIASGQFFIRSWMDLFQESGWRQPGSGLEAANACSSIASAT